MLPASAVGGCRWPLLLRAALHIVRWLLMLQRPDLGGWRLLLLLGFASNSWLMVAKKSMPANDLKDLIAWLKANPDRRRRERLAGVFFQKQTGTTLQFVPYRGAAPAMQLW